MRSLVRETHLEPGALIYPLFLCEGESVRREIPSMPGIFNFSVDEAVKEATGNGLGSWDLGLGNGADKPTPKTKDLRPKT